jgi:hypothetical protein
LQIRSEQMAAFEDSASEAFLRRVVTGLRAKYADRVPASDAELRISAAGWIKDAQCWGFKTESEIIRYVSSVAERHGRREPIETRLAIYLQLHHEPLLAGVDLQAFVPMVLQLASEHQIREDEGVAWLAAILLSGRRRGETDASWLEAVLDSSDGNEETRLLQVHQQAAARGWFIAGGDGQ